MEKINFDLQSGYLYILSGLPGSGKSSFTENAREAPTFRCGEG